MKPVLITRGKNKKQLLYFTTTSFTSDGRYLIFLKEERGNLNIFSHDLYSGQEQQLTFNKDGHLKTYQYFRGQWYKGLGKTSISLHPHTGKIYYLHGLQVCSVDIKGQLRILAEYPDDQVTAYTDISHDGTQLCVATTDAQAFDVDNLEDEIQPNYRIDEQCRKRNLNSYLRVFDTKSGQELICEAIPKAWVTHVQFCPVDNNIILYNNEWCRDGGERRMWLWDGKEHRKLRSLGNGRNSEDWVSHEVWMPDGDSILYHGKYKEGAMFIGKVDLDGENITEISFDPEFTAYGHFSVGNEKLLVSDGYYQEQKISKKSKSVSKSEGCSQSDTESSNNKRIVDSVIGIAKKLIPIRYRESFRRMMKYNSRNKGEWISLLKVDWDKYIVEWIPLCKHGSSWYTQDDHPHPIFSHDRSAIFFTSERKWKRAIYKIDIPHYVLKSE